MAITKGFRALVDEANAQVKTYSVAQMLSRMGSPDLQIVDVRDVRELKDGTIPGSYHAPRCMLEFWVDPASPYYKPLFSDESKDSCCSAEAAGAARWRRNRFRIWA